MPIVYRYLSSELTPSQFKDKVLQYISEAQFELIDEVSQYTYVFKLKGDIYDEYVKLEFSSSEANILLSYAYYWDTSTHSGVATGYIGSSISIPMYLVAADNCLAVFNESDGVVLFRLKPYFNFIKTITQSAQSGSNVPIYLNDTSLLKQNMYVGITTGGTRGRCQVYITNVSSNGIVVQTLPMNVQSGDKLAFAISSWGYAISSSYEFVIPSGLTHEYLILHPTTIWTTPRDWRLQVPPTTAVGETVIDSYYNYKLGIVLDPIYQARPHISNYSVPVCLGVSDIGNISSYTSDSLTDNSKNWTSNELVGKVIVIPDTRDVKTIISNTHNTITINTPFFDGISANKLYIVCDFALVKATQNVWIRVAP